MLKREAAKAAFLFFVFFGIAEPLAMKADGAELFPQSLSFPGFSFFKRSAQGGNSDGLVDQAKQKIKAALYDGGGGWGVFEIGLSVLRTTVIWYLVFYGIYLGISMAFGKGDAQALVSFLLGTIVALTASIFAGFYHILFEKAAT